MVAALARAAGVAAVDRFLLASQHPAGSHPGAAFGTVGFELCSDGSLEHGVEKIALYSSDRGEVTHTARQLPSGNWTSKLGPNIDIMHPTPESLNGPGYGSVSHFLQRQAQAVNVSETEIS